MRTREREDEIKIQQRLPKTLISDNTKISRVLNSTSKQTNKIQIT